ncbi:50S ribosomal protein L29 [Candidatus Peregrinibacteria bacterium]|nr:50S ribosomal protein L29 [Candidatus Peregrinibacteria bacterium]
MLSIQELRSSNRKELLQELEKARKEMLKVRISLKTKHEKDTSKAGKTKRYIAQILTMLKGLGNAPVVSTSEKTVADKPVVAKVAKKAAPKVKKTAKKQA